MSSGYEVMKVKHEKRGIGLVVPDFMGLNCQGSGSVMVDFDGESGIRACPEADLHKLGIVVIRFNEHKCRGCAYANSTVCNRFHAGRMGWLWNSDNTTIIPVRTYPFCQEEMQQAVS